MLKMDLKRAFFLPKWILTVMTSSVILMIACQSGLDDIVNALRGRLDMTGFIINKIDLVMKMDKYKVILVILLANLLTGSFCDDFSSRYVKMILCRTSILRYAASRFLSTAFAVVFSCECVFLGAAVLFRLLGLGLIDTEMIHGYYYGALAEKNPIGYLLLMGMVLGFQAAACSAIGLLYSAYEINRFVSIAISGLVFYLALSYIPAGNVLNIINLTGMLPTLPQGYETPYPLMILWSIAYPGSIILICWWKFCRKLRRRVKNGEI